MYRVKREKIKNVNDRGKIRNFYPGEILPEDYQPPKTYLDQGIVEEVKKSGGKKWQQAG